MCVMCNRTWKKSCTLYVYVVASHMFAMHKDGRYVILVDMGMYERYRYLRDVTLLFSAEYSVGDHLHGYYDRERVKPPPSGSGIAASCRMANF